MEVAHIDVFRNDPARFWAFYADRFATLGSKEPNEAHRVLVKLEQQGLLDGVITQNIDMLHRKAGTRELVEVHGSIQRCLCPDCDAYVELGEARLRLAAEADGVPRCANCGEALKPDVVSFGEYLHESTMQRAQQLCLRAELLLCIGSSHEVHPVAGLPHLILRGGGTLAIITQGPTPLDQLAGIRIHSDILTELSGLGAALDLG
jgi:NAD-dependent deacetylase